MSLRIILTICLFFAASDLWAQGGDGRVSETYSDRVGEDTDSVDNEEVDKLSGEFDVRFNLSLIDQEVTAGPNKGLELLRQPDTIGTVELLFQNERWDANFGYNHRGDSFGDAANNSTLDSFDFLRAGVGYTHELDSGSNLHFGLSVFNRTDEAGLTEGNPRAGGAATGEFIVGRPILPKTTYFRVTYDF